MDFFELELRQKIESLIESKHQKQVQKIEQAKKKIR